MWDGKDVLDAMNKFDADRLRWENWVWDAEMLENISESWKKAIRQTT